MEAWTFLGNHAHPANLHVTDRPIARDISSLLLYSIILTYCQEKLPGAKGGGTWRKKNGLPQAILKAHDRRTQSKAVPIRQPRPMSRLRSHPLACCTGFCTFLNFFLIANFCFLFYDEASVRILAKLLRRRPADAADRLRRKEEWGSPWKKASPVIPLAPE